MRNLEKYFAAIEGSPLFQGMAREELAELLRCLRGERRDYPGGAWLLREGDRARALGLVLSGRALVVQEDFWGNRNLLASLAPGEVFAESFACSPGREMNVSVAAETPCTVLWLRVDGVLSVCPTACPRHSRMIRNLLQVLAEKNLRFQEKLTHMGKRTTRDKLLSYLSAQAVRQGSSTFTIPLNRQQLADYLCVDRSAMSTALGHLRDQGILSFDRDRFTLLAPPPE